MGMNSPKYTKSKFLNVLFYLNKYIPFTQPLTKEGGEDIVDKNITEGCQESPEYNKEKKKVTKQTSQSTRGVKARTRLTSSFYLQAFRLENKHKLTSSSTHDL